MTDEVETQAPSDEGAPAGKTYTQQEVDRLIDIQRRKLKPISDELEALKSGRDDQIQAYEKVITKMVKDMSKEIHPSILKLMEKLSPLEQLDYLSDPENNAAFEKKEFPLPKKKVEGKKEFTPAKIDKFV